MIYFYFGFFPFVFHPQKESESEWELLEKTIRSRTNDTETPPNTRQKLWIMDILWLQNSVSRQFLANAIATLSEQLITINNVVNGLVSDDSGTVATKTDTPINRSNETIFTKKLINSIRGNVACAHRRHDFIGDTDNYQYQSRSVAQSQSQSQLQQQQQHQHHHLYEQQQQPQHHHQHHQQSLQRHPSLSISTRTMNDIKAIGVIVNLDIEKCGTISTYDCDSNYNSTATATYTIHSHCDGVNKCSAQHDVKSDHCNYTNKRIENHKRSTRTTSTSTTSASNLSIDSILNSNSNEHKNDGNASYSNRLNIDSPINIAPISATNKAEIQTQFDKHTQISRNQWWKKLVIVICYLFLLSSSLRICSANKHEGNFFVVFTSFCSLAFSIWMHFLSFQNAKTSNMY